MTQVPEKARLGDVFALVCDPALSDGAVRLWSFYRRYHVNEQGAYVGDEVAAAMLGWSLRKLQDKRAELVQHGCLLVVPRGPGVPARYPLAHPGSHPNVRQESQPNVTQASHQDVTQDGTGSHDASHDASQDASHPTAAPIEDEPGSRVTRKPTTKDPVGLTPDGPNALPPAVPPNGNGKRVSRSVELIKHHLAEELASVAEGTRRAMRAEEVRQLQAELVFAYWAAKMGHEGALLDPKREARLVARLRENSGDVHELLYAVDGARRDPNLMGENERNRKYDGIQTIFRDREQVERLATLAHFKPGKKHPTAVKYLEGATHDSGGGGGVPV